jgi:hypothetical protein
MPTGETFAELSNKTVSAANGIEYVYRDAGEGGVPLVLVQHFRGNLDNWDPALIDELTSSRPSLFSVRWSSTRSTCWGSPSAASSLRKWRTLATCAPADPARDDRRGGG